jgi:hypothetical protein
MAARTPGEGGTSLLSESGVYYASKDYKRKTGCSQGDDRKALLIQR